jgi:hypothetical protein
MSSRPAAFSTASGRAQADGTLLGASAATRWSTRARACDDGNADDLDGCLRAASWLARRRRGRPHEVCDDGNDVDADAAHHQPPRALRRRRVGHGESATTATTTTASLPLQLRLATAATACRARRGLRRRNADDATVPLRLRSPVGDGVSAA